MRCHWNSPCPRRKVFGENLIALPRKQEIFFRNPSFVMCGKRQRHSVKVNVDIRMVIAFLGFPGDSIDKCDAFQEPLKLKCPNDRLSVFRPVREGF